MDSGEIRIKLDKLWVWSFGQLGRQVARLGRRESGPEEPSSSLMRSQAFHVMAAAAKPAPPFARLLLNLSVLTTARMLLWTHLRSSDLGCTQLAVNNYCFSKVQNQEISVLGIPRQIGHSAGGGRVRDQASLGPQVWGKQGRPA